MSSFKKTKTQLYFKPKKSQPTPDAVYWKNFEASPLIKEHGAITHIDISQTEPHLAAVTAFNKVQLYCCKTKQVLRTFSRFRDAAYCGRFRRDGKLLIAGTNDGGTRLFDVGKKTLLRIFDGHRKPVHACHFLPDNRRLVSVSDDTTARVYDIASAELLVNYRGEFKDHVRSVDVTPCSADLFYAGSYDHSARLFDTRMPGSVMCVQHGYPIESILAFPSGGLFVTAGGPVINVWDALNPGKAVASIQRHHMTVTSVALASQGRRLISVGLDKRLKVHDTTAMKEVYASSLPEPALSLAVSPDDGTLAVGMLDGRLFLQSRREEGEDAAKAEEKPFRSAVRSRPYSEVQADTYVAHKKKDDLAKYDRLLQKFQYTKALDSALEPKVRVKNPEVTVAVFRDLIRRRALQATLAGRTDKELHRIIKFLIKNVTDTRFAHTLMDVTNVLLSVYEPSQLSPVQQELSLLLKNMDMHMRYITELEELSGGIDLLVSSTDTQTLDVPAPPLAS